MKPITEKLLQVAAVVFIVYFAWQLALQSIVAQIQANNRAAVAERQLQACMEKK